MVLEAIQLPKSMVHVTWIPKEVALELSEAELLPQVWLGLKLSLMETSLSWLLSLLSVTLLSMLLSQELNIPKHLRSVKSKSIAFADCINGNVIVARLAIPAKVTTRKPR